MSELIHILPEHQIIDLLAQAEANHLDTAEILLRSELTRRLMGSTALSMGVYDANDETPGSPEHPEDDRWIIRGED